MKKEKADEIKLHKHLAKEYVLRHGLKFSRMYHNYLNDEIMKILPKKRNGRVLDLGCGSGILLKPLSKSYNEVYGIDLSPDMLKNAAYKHKNIKKIVKGDAENPKFPKAFFDIVVSRGTIHHLPNPKKSLFNINKILKKKGTLVFLEPCNDFLVLRLLRKMLYKTPKFGDVHKAFLSKEFRSLLKSTGFKVQKERYIGYMGFPLCGFPDIVSFLRYIPGNRIITKGMIGFDRLLSDTPLIRRTGWLLMVKAIKI